MAARCELSTSFTRSEDNFVKERKTSGGEKLWKTCAYGCLYVCVREYACFGKQTKRDEKKEYKNKKREWISVSEW